MTDMVELAEMFARAAQVSVGMEIDGKGRLVTLGAADIQRIARACRAAATKHRPKITLPTMPWDKP
jgi:hypothetical protein